MHAFSAFANYRPSTAKNQVLINTPQIKMDHPFIKHIYILLCTLGVAGLPRPDWLRQDHFLMEGRPGHKDRQVPQRKLLFSRNPHVHSPSWNRTLRRLRQPSQEPEKQDWTYRWHWNPGEGFLGESLAISFARRRFHAKVTIVFGLITYASSISYKYTINGAVFGMTQKINVGKILEGFELSSHFQTLRWVQFSFGFLNKFEHKSKFPLKSSGQEPTWAISPSGR